MQVQVLCVLINNTTSYLKNGEKDSNYSASALKLLINKT